MHLKVTHEHKYLEFIDRYFLTLEFATDTQAIVTLCRYSMFSQQSNQKCPFAVIGSLWIYKKNAWATND